MSDSDQVPKPLTLAFVRHVTVPGRYYDRDGLILTVSSSGAKNWTQRLTIQGRGLAAHSPDQLSRSRKMRDALTVALLPRVSLKR